MVDEIERFLKIGVSSDFGAGRGSDQGSCSDDGYGLGTGNSSGAGSEYGYGFGEGYASGVGSDHDFGYGRGEGAGRGFADGTGDGAGLYNVIQTFNAYRVYVIDGIMTIIYSVHRNCAKGAIIRDNLTTRPCYVARVMDSFAHGDTLRKAYNEATYKAMMFAPVDTRIEMFKEKHPSKSIKYSGRDLFYWHGVLTGSCEFGRYEWCRSKGLSPDSSRLTVPEFCRLTCTAYGGSIIRKLARAMGVRLKRKESENENQME